MKTAILLALICTVPTAASPLDGGPAPRVAQWEAYCERESATDPVCSGADVRGDEASFAQLRRVNARVNKLPYKTDQAMFGEADYWTADLSAKAADCDDSVLIKRRLLIEAGVGAETLFPAMCTLPTTASHIVLLARSGGQLLVLNNETQDIEKMAPRGLDDKCVWHSWLDPHTGEWRAFGAE